jgi:Myo-inositol-1-phosphate synthase
MSEVASQQGRLGVMVAGLGVLGTTFIGGVLLLRRGILTPNGAVTQSDASLLAADAGVAPGKLSALLGLSRLDDLVFGAWSIFPDRAVEVAQSWTLFENDQFEGVADELAEIVPAKAVFNAREVTDGSSGTYIKLKPTKAELAEALNEDMDAFEKKNACRTTVLYCGAPEAPKALSESHASPSAFEVGLRNNDPDITSSQIYSWVCAKRGVSFACVTANQAIGFPAVEESARATATPLAGSGLAPASYRVLDIVSPSAHPPDAEPPCWWTPPLRPEMNPEIRESKFGELIRADRATLPIEDSKRLSPPLLDVALLLDNARRRGWGGTQHWLDVLFSVPYSLRSPEEADREFRETLIRMMRAPAGPGRI